MDAEGTFVWAVSVLRVEVLEISWPKVLLDGLWWHRDWQSGYCYAAALSDRF